VLNPNHGGTGKEVSLRRDETLLSGEKMFCFSFIREWIRGLYGLFRECSWNCNTKLSPAAVQSVQVGILLEKH